MRPVRADDVIPEPAWESPKHLLINLATLIVVWALILFATDVLHVPFAVLIAVGVVFTVVSVTSDILRWRRRRRAKPLA